MARKGSRIKRPGRPGTNDRLGRRRRAAAHNRRNEAYLAQAQRLTCTGSWVLNVTTKRCFWSAELFRIWEFDPAKTKPSVSTLLERVHPSDRSSVEKSIDSATRTGRDFARDCRLLLWDGMTKYVHLVGHPAANKSGKIVEIIGAATDITDRVRAERALRRSEAYLAEAEKISHTGCWARNTATGALFWSQEEWRIFGLDPKKTKLSYRVFLDLVHPDDRALLEAVSTSAVSARKPYDIPFRVVLPDGSIKHLHSVGNPIFQDSGQVAEYIGVTMDVTDRKRTEAALQEAQSELARATRLTTMGELAASIAHEINQPLSAVIANGSASLRWLSRDVPDLAEAQEAMTRVVKEANRASEVIARIRALLRHDKPEYVAVDINGVIRDVLALTNWALQVRDVLLRTRLPAELPLVRGDRIQLQQVIMNLIINGADAMSSINDRPRILRIRSQIDGSGGILVAITDAGSGLDPGIANRIFEPLFTTKPNGMGMGLSICRSIVEAHGGRLWASPGSPNGTVFQFTMPIFDGSGETHCE